MVLPARRVTHAVDILSTFADFSVEAEINPELRPDFTIRAVIPSGFLLA
jgi:hypothetical protein